MNYIKYTVLIIGCLYFLLGFLVEVFQARHNRYGMKKFVLAVWSLFFVLFLAAWHGVFNWLLPKWF